MDFDADRESVNVDPSLFEDPPDEFRDPSSYDIIKEAMRLPGGTVVSKETWEDMDRHKNFVDPCTGQGFSPNDVRPDPAFDERIAQWKRERKASAGK
jgi:hypothetical protein